MGLLKYIYFLFGLCFLFGTGSTPPLHRGLHLKMRQSAKKNPIKAPHSRNASIAYCEQVGKNRQLAPRRGDRCFWYSLTNQIKIRAIIVSIIQGRQVPPEAELQSAGICLPPLWCDKLKQCRMTRQYFVLEVKKRLLLPFGPGCALQRSRAFCWQLFQVSSSRSAEAWHKPQQRGKPGFFRAYIPV